MLTNLAEGADGYTPKWLTADVAILLSSIVFAFMNRRGVDRLSLYGYYLIAGLIVGSVSVLSGDIVLPIGFHVFYIFTVIASDGLRGSQQSRQTSHPRYGWISVLGQRGKFLRVIFGADNGVLLLAYIRWLDGQFSIDPSPAEWFSTTVRES